MFLGCGRQALAGGAAGAIERVGRAHLQREIAQSPEFSAIKQHSLAKLYKDARERLAAK